jgi:hypothetical protein
MSTATPPRFSHGKPIKRTDPVSLCELLVGHWTTEIEETINWLEAERAEIKA